MISITQQFSFAVAVYLHDIATISHAMCHSMVPDSEFMLIVWRGSPIIRSMTQFKIPPNAQLVTHWDHLWFVIFFSCVRSFSRNLGDWLWDLSSSSRSPWMNFNEMYAAHMFSSDLLRLLLPLFRGLIIISSEGKDTRWWNWSAVVWFTFAFAWENIEKSIVRGGALGKDV